ncbi:MAG: bifunctional glutamate N-acetyltransferase/amino-acid acetyltransferase ArgJ [Candidatus Hydrogenedentes bacterium]|nr:bifunctional glutamate N-acetyltransferase/amino-acid acetyltransferase ArgJ [Candidatus Hydrogenedentota bacterium]
MNRISGGVTAPQGFRAAGVDAEIKPGSTKKDCALVVSDVSATVAGVFTTNVVKAAPVRWCQEVCRRGTARAVFINSGNANACTGAQGERDVETTAQRVAQSLGLEPNEVCVCSTGVIGVPLPMDRITKGVDACAAALSEKGGGDAAAAILTTDMRPKEIAIALDLAAGRVCIGGMVKGAGMIAPNMATMLCFITTDAKVTPRVMQDLLRQAADKSFNRLCVDNDTSTNDSVICLANGRAMAAPLAPNTSDYAEFARGLEFVCAELAKEVVRDGEGATKFVEIIVEGAASNDAALKIARAIGQSQLCKTAFFGNDPNWGRIACAAGYAGVPFEPNALAIWINDLQIAHGGTAAAYEEADAAAQMKKSEFTVRVAVGDGPGKTIYWTSDLSYDYVRINADYRS